MNHSKLFLTSIFFICLITLPQLSFGQYSTTECQTITTALIGPDRNDFVHNNGIDISEGYLHNFDPPTLPCGINNPNITSLVVNIDLTNITTNAGCAGIPIFGNVLLNCPLTTSSICPIIQDVLTPGCNNFGAGTTTTGMYSLDIATCNPISATDVIGVDIIPATDFSPSCPSNGMAISDGTVSVTYQICLDYTYDQAVPPSCTNTIIQACDDGNPCTVNDMETVDNCDNSIVCIPCAGVLADCSNTGCQTILPCDDGNPCTDNDVETLAADGSICIPCAGILSDCANVACQSTLPCDDGNPCTSNDMETLAADGSVCLPCAGILSDCANVACQSTLPCDDGNPCTSNDMETLAADGSVCVPCAGILSDCANVACQSTLPCNDGNPCTSNDMETFAADGSVCVPCAGTQTDCSTGTTTILPCDDADACTINDVQTVLNCDGSICVPCMGIPVPCGANGSCEAVLPCDDGDPCTINDNETFLLSDGSICQPCAGTPAPCGANGSCEAVLPCDDGDPCTINDIETTLLADGSICQPCAGFPAPCGANGSCEAVLPCDDGDPCTINDIETTLLADGSICQPCAGTPIDCSNGTTSIVACDDGDATTTNDMQTILDCDGSICVPCMGTPVDCSTGTTSIVPCDDGDACTINDEQTVLDSDGTICVPCSGTPIDCSTGTTSIVACDDGDSNTTNDEQTILDCDGSICVPCMGTLVDCSTGTTSVVSCDDGDACTINDEQTVLDSDGTICVPCQGTTIDCSNGTTSIVACDDGDSNTTNDEQTILDCDGSICIPCQGIPVDCSNGSTSVVACDDGDACTINDEQTVLDSDGTICIPCLGIPTDCATGMTTNLPCDDGNPNTFNDIEIILACDGTICFPCSGTLCNVIAFIQDPVATLNCQSLNNGVILESTGSSTGPNLSYQWIFSNNTIGTGAAIEIFEEGNYTLLITDNSNGCFSSFDLEVTVPIVELIPTLLINPESCQNEADGSIIIDTVIGGQPPYLFSLNSGTFVSATQYQNLTPGNYDFTIQDADGCETFLELNVPAANALTLDLGPDEAINLGDSLQLAIFSNLIIDTIIWEFDESINCTNCLDPIVTPVYETQYSVTLIDINGCEISDQIVVFVDKTERIFIPNAFSPNGDGANDLFMIYAGSDVRIIRNFRIFDRWGASLFSRNNFDPNDSQFGWDGIHKGKVVAPGVYVYYAEIEFEDGRVEVKSGDVTVMK